MRLLFSTIIALTVSLCLYAIVKMWGQSQVYIDYKHPFTAVEELPLVFKIPKDNWTLAELHTTDFENFYLNFAVTQDGIGVILRRPIEQVRTRKYSDIQDSVYTAEQISSLLKNKKIIFNYQENPIAGPEIFVEYMKKIGFHQTRNFMVISPYEVPMKSLKEKEPTYIFGTSKPEILRIKALENLWAVEAATFRADVVVHPETYYNQLFFTDTLLSELQRRFKRFIVGPVQSGDLEKSKQHWHSKGAFAIIVSDQI